MILLMPMRKIFLKDYFLNHKSSRGFTLIELLIVVAIIGILATLLMTNFIGVRQRARDAQRKSDLRQIQSALELYRSDNGGYPTTNGEYRLPNSVGVSACPSAGSFTYSNTTYMKKVPCDSLGTSYYNNGNYYYDSSDGVNYTLAACLENTNDGDTNDTSNAPTGSSGCPNGYKYFVLQNP